MGEDRLGRIENNLEKLTGQINLMMTAINHLNHNSEDLAHTRKFGRGQRNGKGSDSKEDGRGQQQEEVGKRLKVEIPDFFGTLNPDECLDWLWSVERMFEYMGFDDVKMFRVVILKLKGHALLWYTTLKAQRFSEGKPAMKSWIKLRKKIEDKFIPSDCKPQKSFPFLSLNHKHLYSELEDMKSSFGGSNRMENQEKSNKESEEADVEKEMEDFPVSIEPKVVVDEPQVELAVCEVSNHTQDEEKSETCLVSCHETVGNVAFSLGALSLTYLSSIESYINKGLCLPPRSMYELSWPEKCLCYEDFGGMELESRGGCKEEFVRVHLMEFCAGKTVNMAESLKDHMCMGENAVCMMAKRGYKCDAPANTSWVMSWESHEVDCKPKQQLWHSYQRGIQKCCRNVSFALSDCMGCLDKQTSFNFQLPYLSGKPRQRSKPGIWICQQKGCGLTAVCEVVKTDLQPDFRKCPDSAFKFKGQYLPVQTSDLVDSCVKIEENEVKFNMTQVSSKVQKWFGFYSYFRAGCLPENFPDIGLSLTSMNSELGHGNDSYGGINKSNLETLKLEKTFTNTRFIILLFDPGGVIKGGKGIEFAAYLANDGSNCSYFFLLSKTETGARKEIYKSKTDLFTLAFNPGGTREMLAKGLSEINAEIEKLQQVDICIGHGFVHPEMCASTTTLDFNGNARPRHGFKVFDPGGRGYGFGNLKTIPSVQGIDELRVYVSLWKLGLISARNLRTNSFQTWRV